MKTMVSVLLALAAGAVGAAWTFADPIPDVSLGLQKGSVFAVPMPPPVRPNETAPGEQKAPVPPYVGSPPTIPHSVADFLPITSQQNVCLDCHAVGEKDAGGPTPIPPSHYTDPRRAPEKVGEKVSGLRYVCVSCHVSTTDAVPLVPNHFRP